MRSRRFGRWPMICAGRSISPTSKLSRKSQTICRPMWTSCASVLRRRKRGTMRNFPIDKIKEGRMIAAHMLGRHDYDERKPMLVPVYLTDKDEIDAYRAGYLGNARRDANGGGL